MIPGGYPPRPTLDLWTCRYCGRLVFRSRYCSWRCARRGEWKFLAIGLALWAVAAVIATLVF
jgi:hypothetical protein